MPNIEIKKLRDQLVSILGKELKGNINIAIDVVTNVEPEPTNYVGCVHCLGKVLKSSNLTKTPVTLYCVNVALSTLNFNLSKGFKTEVARVCFLASAFYAEKAFVKVVKEILGNAEIEEYGTSEGKFIGGKMLKKAVSNNYAVTLVRLNTYVYSEKRAINKIKINMPKTDDGVITVKLSQGGVVMMKESDEEVIDKTPTSQNGDVTIGSYLEFLQHMPKFRVMDIGKNVELFTIMAGSLKSSLMNGDMAEIAQIAIFRPKNNNNVEKLLADIAEATKTKTYHIINGKGFDGKYLGGVLQESYWNPRGFAVQRETIKVGIPMNNEDYK